MAGSWRLLYNPNINLLPASTKHCDIDVFELFILKPGDTIEIARRIIVFSERDLFIFLCFFDTKIYLQQKILISDETCLSNIRLYLGLILYIQ